MSATYQAATGDSSRWPAAAPFGGVPSRLCLWTTGSPPRAIAGVERGEIGQPQAHPSERHGQRRVRALGQHGAHAGLLQARMQPARAQRFQHLHGRDVQRLGQRRADRHRAVPVVIEVLGDVDAKAGRPVLDQRLGMGEAKLEGQAVDDRLQGGARRAYCIRHVDRAETLAIEQPRGSDLGDHLARAMVDRDDRCGKPPAQRRAVVLHELFEGWPAPGSRG